MAAKSCVTDYRRERFGRAVWQCGLSLKSPYVERIERTLVRSQLAAERPRCIASGFESDYAASLHQKIILVDGRRLWDLMIEHGIGVTKEHAYTVKKIDSDYFYED